MELITTTTVETLRRELVHSKQAGVNELGPSYQLHALILRLHLCMSQRSTKITLSSCSRSPDWLLVVNNSRWVEPLQGHPLSEPSSGPKLSLNVHTLAEY